MSGGIFPGRPFHLNIKCIIFTFVIAAGYWYLPSRKMYILAFLLWLPYVALAWYDYSYDCNDKLQPTIIPYGRYLFLPFKPPGYNIEFNKMSKDQIQAMNSLDHITTWTLLVTLMYFYFKAHKT